MSSAGSHFRHPFRILCTVGFKKWCSLHVRRGAIPAYVPICSLTTHPHTVQPTHPGVLVQIGFNAGPRHARVFGLAKSYTVKIDHKSAVSHDEDAIAAMTLAWALSKSLFPTRVLAEIESCLSSADLPRIATRNIEEGESTGLLASCSNFLIFQELVTASRSMALPMIFRTFNGHRQKACFHRTTLRNALLLPRCVVTLKFETAGGHTRIHHIRNGVFRGMWATRWIHRNQLFPPLPWLILNLMQPVVRPGLVLHLWPPAQTRVFGPRKVEGTLST